MNDITFERQPGGLARQLPSEDHISGIIFYGFALPTGFGTDRIKRLTCLEDAEQLGIAAGSVDYAIIHYHVSEFYRIAPGAILFLGLFATPQTWNFEEVWTMKQFAQGKIRQYSIYTQRAFVGTDVEKIQLVMEKLHTEHAPASALYAADFSAIQENGLEDLRELECPRVSVVLGQDGSGVGAALYASSGKSISCIGAVMGAVAKASVHESIAYVKKFRMDDVVELSVPCLANGDAIGALTFANVDDINNKGYIFLINHVGKDATYLNDSFCAVASDSDYATIENNRTMDKMEREVRRALLPELSAPLYVDPSSGKLDPDTIAYFEAIANEPLAVMERSKELSGVSVTIPADQNVLTTSELQINIGAVPVGVARKIKVKIGFKLKL